MPENDMLLYERELWGKGFRCLAGVDEAGRGPLAGPVVAACVILNPDYLFPEADDSKKLSAKKRESLYDDIWAHALSVSVGIADNETIDRVNILQATFLAMREAVSKARIKPDYVLIDGDKKPFCHEREQTIISGDGKSMSIACASIIAKVTRDRIMLRAAEEYPQYGFEMHKGYGTELHRQRLHDYKNCPLHRKTFIRNILSLDEIR